MSDQTTPSEGSEPVGGSGDNAQSGDGALVITPTYNERDNLEAHVAGVFAHAPLAHVLIVDDASPDGTGQLADAIALRDERVFVLHRPRKLGLGPAYLAGFDWGLARSYSRFFEMDADLSHDARYLPEFLCALEAGADVVLGSRNIAGGGVEGWGPVRQVISRGGSLYARTVLGLDLRDLTTGYRLYTRAALLALGLPQVQSAGYAFQVELAYRAVKAGLRVVEVPIWFVDRRAGQSKMSRQIFVEAAIMVLRLKWRLR